MAQGRSSRSAVGPHCAEVATDTHHPVEARAAEQDSRLGAGRRDVKSTWTIVRQKKKKKKKRSRLRLTGQVGRRLVSVASGPRFDSRMNVGFSFERKKFGSPVWRTHRGEQRFALAQTLPYHFVAARRDRAAQISLDGLHNAVVRPGVCHPSPEPRPLPRYGRAGLLLVTTSLRRSVLAGPSPHNLPQGWYWWRSGYPSLARHRWCEALPALPLGVCECEWNVSASLLRIHKQPPLPVSLPPGQSSVKKKKKKKRPLGKGRRAQQHAHPCA